MKFIYIFFFLFILFRNIDINAQEIETNSIEKNTFLLYSGNSNISQSELVIYKIALLEFSQLDEFRFLNERRTIHFEKNQIAVELFSANELAEQYGKEISPYTIVPGKTYLPVTFQLINWNDGYAIHPVYEKLNLQTH